MHALLEKPGFVNAHTHLYSGLVPLGMPSLKPPPRDFLDILGRLWWRLDRALDADTLRAAARYYVAHALLAGTTTLIDHHESPSMIENSLDIIADACTSLGIRAVLCYGATERNAGVDEADRGLAECRRFAMSHRAGTVRAMVGVHAPFTVSDSTLRAAGVLCRELELPLHIHVAEDYCDVRDAHHRGHVGVVERLLACGALPAGSILAHGVHLEKSQVAKAEDQGAWWVQNPRSNRNNRVGIPKALMGSRRVALGTDGFPSVLEDEVQLLRTEIGQSVAGEAEIQHRLRTGTRIAAEIYGEAAIANDRIWLANDGSQRVLQVQVDGEIVVRDGALVHGSLAQIEAEAHAAATRLWRRM